MDNTFSRHKDKMKNWARQILLMTTVVFTAAMLTSCIYENEPDMQPEFPEGTGNLHLFFKMGILDAPTRAGETNEMMHSLRIVMLDENGDVEYNNMLNFDEPQITYDTHIFTYAGHKKLFFIANESSVNYITGPETTASLTAFLEGYEKGDPGFADAVSALYFSLDTSKPLPLTAEYDIDPTIGQEDFEFWLVRAATKYSIHFENSRSEAVFLNELSISYFAEANYLIPHVGTKTIDGEFWIDWLHKISDASNEDPNNTNPGNTSFNNTHGWITDYWLPTNINEKVVFTPITGANYQIDEIQSAAGQEPTPGTLDLGPFYAPESKNLIDPNNLTGNQQYTLTLKLTDNIGKKEVVQSRILPNLNALFRNTHLVINVTMSEGYMHIYAEIRKWEMRTDVYGTLTEEEE